MENPENCWKVSRGPIKPDWFALEMTRAINDMLTEPLSVLPTDEQDAVRPFRIGLGHEIMARMRPDGDIAALRKALRRYTHGSAYLLATAQPDAMRHDLSGKPVEPVAEEDRLNARRSFVSIREWRRKRREEREQQGDLAGAQPPN